MPIGENFGINLFTILSLLTESWLAQPAQGRSLSAQ